MIIQFSIPVSFVPPGWLVFWAREWAIYRTHFNNWIYRHFG